MAGGKRRITLENPTKAGVWARVREWFGGASLDSITPTLAEDRIDYSLARRAERRAVREFIESIDTYQLHTRRTVHVVSRYRVPSDAGLEQRVPEWLAERVRFGVVRGDFGDIGYLRIKAVEVHWDDHGTELYLQLAQKVVPGTRAFIAAYLGDEGGFEQIGDLPTTLLLGEPR